MNGHGGAHNKAKTILKKSMTMAFYSEEEQLCLESDVVLGASLLQVRDGMWFSRNESPYNTALQPIAFTSKSLTNTDTSYINTERKALGIPHGPEKLHYYSFPTRSV